jgi:hypothetical protein
MKSNKKMLMFAGVLICLAIIASACGGKEPDQSSAAPELPEDVESLVMLAKFDLTLKTGVDIDKITTVKTEETLFDDSSLGVPQPGVAYEAVITPGYIITLEAGGKQYEYHASGALVVQVPE